MHSLTRTARSAAVGVLAAAALAIPSAAFASGQYPPQGQAPESTPGVTPDTQVLDSEEQAAGLPRTGSTLAPWAAGGSALVLAGGVLVVASRRRQQGQDV